jgi:hypothetical protein
VSTKAFTGRYQVCESRSYSRDEHIPAMVVDARARVNVAAITIRTMAVSGTEYH